MRVTVIGTGYVGTVTGACLAYLGHRVTCVDTDLSKIEKLRLGQPPIYSQQGSKSCWFWPTIAAGSNFETDLESPVRESDVIFIAVGDSSAAFGGESKSGVPRKCGPGHRRCDGPIPVPRGCEQIHCAGGIEEPGPEGAGAGTDITPNRIPSCRTISYSSVASSPEFLREGSAIHDSLYPDRIVVGADDPTTLHMMRQLYGALIEQQFDEPSFNSPSGGIAIRGPRSSHGGDDHHQRRDDRNTRPISFPRAEDRILQ